MVISNKQREAGNIPFIGMLKGHESKCIHGCCVVFLVSSMMLLFA